MTMLSFLVAVSALLRALLGCAAVGPATRVTDEERSRIVSMLARNPKAARKFPAPKFPAPKFLAPAAPARSASAVAARERAVDTG